MGYNFWFKLVINKENKDKFINYINSNGLMNDIGYIAKFEFDKHIQDYLYSYHSDDEIKKIMEIHKRADIGYIFLEECLEEDQSNLIGFSFMAASKYMSQLFKESESIYKWFIELSKLSNSLLTYIDFEHFGYRIIFHKGKEVNVDIKYDEQEHDYSNIPEFSEIMDDFCNLAKIYFLGQ